MNVGILALGVLLIAISAVPVGILIQKGLYLALIPFGAVGIPAFGLGVSVEGIGICNIYESHQSLKEKKVQLANFKDEKFLKFAKELVGTSAHKETLMSQELHNLYTVTRRVEQLKGDTKSISGDIASLENDLKNLKIKEISYGKGVQALVLKMQRYFTRIVLRYKRSHLQSYQNEQRELETIAELSRKAVLLTTAN